MALEIRWYQKALVGVSLISLGTHREHHITAVSLILLDHS
jgi:hypothetical protein